MSAPSPKTESVEPSLGLEPLLTIEDLASALACSRRLVERMRAGGKLPKPDLHVGRMPRWRRSTIVRWIAQGGR